MVLAVADAFELGVIDIDPDDDDLASQLGSLRYSFDSRGRVRIETKDEMRSRGMPSPDRADALMLAWASALMVPDQVFTFDAVSDAEEAAVAADLAEWGATCAGYQTQVDEAAALLGVESPRVLSWANEFKRAAAEADDELARLRLALRIERMPADVNVAVVRSFLARVRDRALGADVSKSLTPGQQVIKIVHEELVNTLGGEVAPLRQSSPPQVILMVGLQGSGKTTTAGKLAKHLKSKGRRPLLVAADLQRPAAIDQLETLGQRVGVPVYAERKSKPARVVKAALKEATRAGHDVVIVDTAGRLQIEDALMKELADIAKVAEPDETLLVVDAMTGQDAVNVAKGFVEHTDLTGVVLSKLDGDARAAPPYRCAR